MKSYFSLHTHSIRSINDAILKLPDYIDKLKSFDVPYVPITNHGSMSDVFDLYKLCKENEVTPVIGCEFYICEDRLKKEKGYDHIILIAKNKIGFENLIKIHNDSHLNGFYYKPRTDLDFLSKHGEGLICLSACVAGTIPKKILNLSSEDKTDEELDEGLEEIKDLISMYKSIFDDFYLEIQPGNFEAQKLVNSLILDIASITGTKVVLTNDVHYLNREDAKDHNLHVCAGRKVNMTDELLYKDDCFYVMSNDDLYTHLDEEFHPLIESWINNAHEIASQVEDYDIVPDNIYMPKYDVPDSYTEDLWLQDLAFKGLEKKMDYIEDPAEYTERLLHELSVISTLKFSGYFLTVEDFISYAKNNDILTGPGRGSVCGCLVAYLIGITKVDPIRFGLLFERFLSVHRLSEPDVDVDFDADKRYMMFDYVVDKYGKDHCSAVSVFGERKSKSAIKDTGKMHNIDPDLVDFVASLIPTVYYMDSEDGGTEKMTDISIEDAIDIVPEFKSYYEQFPDWINSAIKLSNIPKLTSLHAAGVIISPISLTDKIPMIKNSTNENLNATSLSLDDVQSAGFVKFDFLSLATLSVLNRTKKLINKSLPNHKHIDDIYDFVGEAYDDPKVWEVIASSKTSSLFQIASPTYKQRMGRLGASTIEELAACLALVRGPCIASKEDEKYINILEGKEEIELVHPIYDEVTRSTNGILIYQEQLMQICFNAGLSLEEGYDIMKLSANKKMKKLEKYRDKFEEAALEKGLSYETIDIIFKKIVASGLYSFNKSHAIAYAILCYITAYFKVYFPLEFSVSNLTNDCLRSKDLKDVVLDCRRMGFKFLPLDVNKSEYEFSIENGAIRIGFCALRSFSLSAYYELLRLRPINKIEDLTDNAVKKILGKKAIIPMILSGSFSSIYPTMDDLFHKYYGIIKEDAPSEVYIQGLKTKPNINSHPSVFEEMLLGFPFINDPANSLAIVDLDAIGINKRFAIDGIFSKVKKHKDKNKNEMAFVELTTGNGVLDVVIFSKTYAQFKKSIKKSVKIKASLTKKQDSYILNELECV